MKKSKIYLYDCKTEKQLDALEGSSYLDGSHETDWQGIIVEKVISNGTFASNVYIKDCHLLLALEEINFVKNGEAVNIESGEIIIAARNKPFTVDNPGTYTGLFITLSIEFLKEYFYDKNIEELEFIDFYRIDDANLKHLILLIYQQALLKTSKEDLFLVKLFEALSVYYVHHYSNYFKESHGLFTGKDMAKIDQYILDNLSENISTMALAELLHISNYTFLKEFKKYTNDVPSKYIHKIKLERAKRQLKSNKITITEIATSLGFFDNSHFTHFFRKREEMTPKQYRKKYKQAD